MKSIPRIALGGIAMGVLGLAAWQLLPPATLLVAASDSLEFDLECEFDRFRQIMVRKNATRAIVNHAGMELLSEDVHDLKVDTSADHRPLLNAILGQSKLSLAATKTLTVRPHHPSITVESLSLRQRIHAAKDELTVKTAADGSQGEVERYATNLIASRMNGKTHVKLSIDMKIRVSIPKLFASHAKARVETEATAALQDQRAAITDLVAAHAHDVVILPDFGSS